MKIKTQTKRIVVDDEAEVEIFIPQVQSFYFETFIRRSICITPIWTTWNLESYNKPEEIFSLDVVCIYQSHEDKIEKYSIQISQIQSLYNSKENSKEKSIVEFLFYNDKYSKRTKEQFFEDYYKIINKFNKILNKDGDS